MNYYNPYFMPYTGSTAARGLFSGLLGRGINFSSILSGTQKTLNIVNQAIPVVKQVTPMFKNAKTMFKVMNEFKKVDKPIDTSVSSSKEVSNDLNSPTFFQ